MGRYYSGDIEGKFWFGIQSSTAADRFGVNHETPNFVEYYYQEDDLPALEAEINRIIENLGEQLQKIEHFFEFNNGYTDKMMEDLGITRKHLSEYADLKLGIKIKDCIERTGVCSFEAEL